MNQFRHGAKVLWLNAGFYGGLIFITVVGIIFVSVPVYCWLRYGRGFDTGEAIRYIIWLYGRAWTKLLAFFVPVSLDQVDKPLPEPCIFVPNHQSFFDTYCFGFMRYFNVVFAVRAWPFRIPFYSPYMRMAEYLNTEDVSAEDVLAQAKALLAKGVSITVFPEGHRSVTGELLRFRAGAFYLANLTNTPVVPLCINGTGVFLKKGSLLLTPSTISFRVLDPIFPEQFAQYGDEAPRLIRRAAKAQLEQALLELRKENPVVPQ
jgi:1-acyl-sn-glycerol-3-phosphate acyltransferase